MNKEDLKNKTIEELQSELGGIKKIMGGLIGVLIVLFAAVIYGLLTIDEKGTFYALLAVAISCSAIVPLNYGKIKEINKELKSRESIEG